MIFLTLEATLINELDFISYLSRRSPVYNKNLSKNYLLTENDIIYLRPENKKSNLKIKKILNKKIRSRKKKYQYI